MAEIIDTSAGPFEIGWGFGSDGSCWLEVDPDGGKADNPWIEEMESVEDVEALFLRLGVTSEEAAALAVRLWPERPVQRS